MQASEFAVHRNHVLPRGRLLSIRDGRETVIYVRRGRVWVTQQGDPRDRELGPGDWFQLDRDGLSIVQAYERSALTLTCSRDGGLRNMFGRFWSGLFAPLARRPLPGI